MTDFRRVEKTLLTSPNTINTSFDRLLGLCMTSAKIIPRANEKDLIMGDFVDGNKKRYKR
jgi:hypothetical protein